MSLKINLDTPEIFNCSEEDWSERMFFIGLMHVFTDILRKQIPGLKWSDFDVEAGTVRLSWAGGRKVFPIREFLENLTGQTLPTNLGNEHSRAVAELIFERVCELRENPRTMPDGFFRT